MNKDLGDSHSRFNFPGRVHIVAFTAQRKFLVFAAVPISILSIAGSSAFTFGQDVSQINGTQEQTDYLVVASNTTSTNNYWTQTSYIGDSPDLTSTVQNGNIPTVYGELPQWFQVNSGAGGVPSAVQEPGDLLFIDARSSTTASEDTNNGLGGAGGVVANGDTNTNVVQAIHVKGNITNIAAMRQTYATCLIPIRLYSTTQSAGANASGAVFTEVTQTYLDTQTVTDTNGNGLATNNRRADALPDQAVSANVVNPFYVDCTTGEFEFTVPTAAAVVDTAVGAHYTGYLSYEVTVERGGVFSTFNNNTGAQPEFVFQSTPLTYDPTNQFNSPGATGNGQYTPSLKNS